MTSRPLVSVVVPVFDAEPFLRETLDSVLAQDYEPFEVIVVDDGSTDGSAAIARSYSEVRYLRQENRGPATARNAGIEAARGEIVAFCDADDVVMRGKLSVQVGYLLAHPEVSGTLGHQVWMSQPPELRDRAWAGAAPVQPTALVIWKRALVEVGGFDASLRVTEDMDLLIRLRQHGHRVAVQPDVVMRRRYHGGNLVAGRGVDPLLPVKLLKAKLDRDRAAGNG